MALLPTIQCFIALRPSEQVAKKLFKAVENLDLPGMRRTSAQDMHITLKFLGDIEHNELPAIIDAIREATAKSEPFELEIQKLGYFPKPEKPRVLVAHTNHPDELTQLANNLNEAMMDAGFRRDGRSFQPHITLGRFRKSPNTPPDLGEDTMQQLTTGGEPAWFEVADIVLMESVRRKSGASYAQMGVFDLG